MIFMKASRKLTAQPCSRNVVKASQWDQRQASLLTNYLPSNQGRAPRSYTHVPGRSAEGKVEDAKHRASQILDFAHRQLHLRGLALEEMESLV